MRTAQKLRQGLAGDDSLRNTRTSTGATPKKIATAAITTTPQRALHQVSARQQQSPRLDRLRLESTLAHYAHLLSGHIAVESIEAPEATVPATHQPIDDRITALQQIIAQLRSEVGDLRQQLEAFRKLFE